MALDPIARPLCDLLGDRSNAAIVDVDRATAVRTDHVVVVIIRLARDVGVLAVRQIDALHDAEVHEQVQGPEDGRPADARLARPCVRQQGGRGEVALTAFQRRRDGPPWLGQTVTGSVERPQDVPWHRAMILSLSEPDRVS